MPIANIGYDIERWNTPINWNMGNEIELTVELDDYGSGKRYKIFKNVNGNIGRLHNDYSFTSPKVETFSSKYKDVVIFDLVPIE